MATADVAVEAETAIVATRVVIVILLTLTIAEVQLETSIEAVGEPVPDQDPLTMIDIIAQMVEAAETMKTGPGTVVLVASGTGVGSEPRALRGKANPQLRNRPKTNVIDVLSSYNSLPPGSEQRSLFSSSRKSGL